MEWILQNWMLLGAAAGLLLVALADLLLLIPGNQGESYIMAAGKFLLGLKKDPPQQ